MRFGWILPTLAAFCLAACGDGGDAGSTGGVVSLPPVNRAPVANAGPDQNLVINSTVTLDGRASSDADGDALTYSWSVIAPDSRTVTLGLPASAQPDFVVTQVGTYVATLTVSDGKATSTADTANIVVPNPWASVSALPATRTGGYAAIAVGSKIYVLGGMAADTPLARVDVYDTVSDTWSAAIPDPNPREGAAIIAVGTKIYTIGGGPVDIGKCFTPSAKTVEIYDTVSNTWSNGPDLQFARTAIIAASAGSTVYAINGYWKGTVPANFCTNRDYFARYPPINESWDTLAGTWRTAPVNTVELPLSRGGTSTSFNNGGAVTIGQTFFLMGIQTANSNLGSGPNSAILRFDATAGTWISPGNMPRWTPFIGLLSGRIYAVSDGVDRYDPVTGTWATAKAPVPSGLFVNTGTTNTAGAHPMAVVGSKIYQITETSLFSYDPAKDAF